MEPDCMACAEQYPNFGGIVNLESDNEVVLRLAEDIHLVGFDAAFTVHGIEEINGWRFYWLWQRIRLFLAWLRAKEREQELELMTVPLIASGLIRKR